MSVSLQRLNRCQQLAVNTATRHGTKDPLQLIEALNISYAEIAMPPNMHGMTVHVGGAPVIIINKYLDERQLTRARAHELGHALMHDHADRYLIMSSTLFPPGKFEREANEFADALLFGNSDRE